MATDKGMNLEAEDKRRARLEETVAKEFSKQGEVLTKHGEVLKKHGEALVRIEERLALLATKDDLAGLVTKDDLKSAFADHLKRLRSFE